MLAETKDLNVSTFDAFDTASNVLFVHFVVILYLYVRYSIHDGLPNLILSRDYQSGFADHFFDFKRYDQAKCRLLFLHLNQLLGTNPTALTVVK